ncbi:MAG: chemotaxis protein CheW [Chloroherpetonaceae bacterium]|nr:chemotaxis protein CheW [Chloroherpetonaceae bacterium]
MFSCLEFKVGCNYYAIDTDVVKQIWGLPELKAWSGMPVDMLGTVTYRGRVLPVLDMRRRLGIFKECLSSNQLIVVESGQTLLGLVVDEVVGVCSISPFAFMPVDDTVFSYPFSQLLQAITEYEGRQIGILDTHALIHCPREIQDVLRNSCHQTQGSNFYQLYMPNATMGERELLRLRAIALSDSTPEDTETLAENLVLVKIETNLWAIPVNQIQEFLWVSDIVNLPRPSTGLMQGVTVIRGEIIPVLDIRENRKTARKSSVVIFRWNQLFALAVDSFYEIISVDQGSFSLDRSVYSEYSFVFENQIVPVLAIEKLVMEARGDVLEKL